MSRVIQIQRVPASPKAPEIVRVAAYARVSADKDAAFHSLEVQTEYYENCIVAHPDWKLVAIYSNNAISGTVVDRPEFQRMMEDARAGKIDRIITKSITRFARDTVVLLESVRELKRLGVDVYFEKEDMHSISPDGELLLTLLAMYAEEEARSASENQKWRIKKKFEQGQTTVGKMLGYRLVNGKLTTVPEEAEVVRQIFRDFLSGMSIHAITKKLNRSALPASRSDIWGRATIAKILKNEKYTGVCSCKRHTARIFVLRSAPRTTDKCQCIKWRIVMKRLSARRTLLVSNKNLQQTARKLRIMKRNRHFSLG